MMVSKRVGLMCVLSEDVCLCRLCMCLIKLVWWWLFLWFFLLFFNFMGVFFFLSLFWLLYKLWGCFFVYVCCEGKLFLCGRCFL